MGAVTVGHIEANRPAITVITIIYNEERFLAEAIDSVLVQGNVDWELVLVDDGSTDASPTIAQRYADRHPSRVRLVRHLGGVNRGMSASRNLGIAESRGRWLSFLDADDVWLPGKLAAQLAVLDRFPSIELLASPAQWWRSWAGSGNGAGDWVQQLGSDAPGDEVVQPPELLVGFLHDEWRSICDLVISRRAVESIGCYEPVFRGMYEDQVFHAKVLARLPAIVTERWWYRYRQHPEACTATSHRDGAHAAARRRYLDWLWHYVQDNGSRSAELERLVRHHRRRARYPRLTRVADRLSALGA
jgi:glycosyltransferase involved in cell wall biosynthesis